MAAAGSTSVELAAADVALRNSLEWGLGNVTAMKGQKGEVGLTGLQGIKGEVGHTGATGNTGACDLPVVMR